MTIPAWMAAPVARPCATAPDRWFSPVVKDQKTAVALCKRCPLLVPCQQYALEQRPTHGVWGGLTERARRSDRVKSPAPRRSSAVPVDCDSPTSFFQHRRRGEACEPCEAKRAAQLTRERRARLDTEHATHGGSVIGYHAHVALGEDPCEACRDANIRRLAEARARRRHGARSNAA